MAIRSRESPGDKSASRGTMSGTEAVCAGVRVLATRIMAPLYRIISKIMAHLILARRRWSRRTGT